MFYSIHKFYKCLFICMFFADFNLKPPTFDVFHSISDKKNLLLFSTFIPVSSYNFLFKSYVRDERLNCTNESTNTSEYHIGKYIPLVFYPLRLHFGLGQVWRRQILHVSIIKSNQFGKRDWNQWPLNRKLNFDSKWRALTIYTYIYVYTVYKIIINF